MLKMIQKIMKDNEGLKHFENGNSQEDFWDNDHISKMMLIAHLNPTWDAASRNHKTIDASVAWIYNSLDLKPGQKMLDLGCGPGLYASRFTDLGLKVRGIDYSRRSLAHARTEAHQAGQDIDYCRMNYLDLEEVDTYDVVVLIYCDFGVLSPDKRSKLLKSIHRALKPTGRLVLDVWSKNFKTLNTTYKDWFLHEKQGFWKDGPHLELVNKTYDDSAGVSLKQHIIVENEKLVHVYNLWEQCYCLEGLTGLMTSHGFKVVDAVSDLTGRPYSPSEDVIGLVVEKEV